MSELCRFQNAWCNNKNHILESEKNNELWKHMKQPRIDLQIRKRKCGWPGHTLRKPADDITRQGLQWNPQGKRSRGRQKNTWRRAVLEGATGVKKDLGRD